MSGFLALNDELSLIKSAKSSISASLPCLQGIGCALCATPLGYWLFMPSPSLATPAEKKDPQVRAMARELAEYRGTSDTATLLETRLVIERKIGETGQAQRFALRTSPTLQAADADRAPWWGCPG